MTKVLEPKRDYSVWFTKQAAATTIGVSTKTIENYVKEGKIHQASWKRPTGGPRLAVYNPEDVNRLAHRMSNAVIIDQPGSNGHADQRMTPVAAPLNGPALIEAVLQTIQKASQNSEKLFLTIPEAAQFTGLSQAYIRRQCQAGTVAAIQDAGWKIRRSALVAL